MAAGPDLVALAAAAAAAAGKQQETKAVAMPSPPPPPPLSQWRPIPRDLVAQVLLVLALSFVFGCCYLIYTHANMRAERQQMSSTVAASAISASLYGQVVTGTFGGHSYRIEFKPDQHVLQDLPQIDCGKFHAVTTEGILYTDGEKDRRTLVRFTCGPALKLVNVIEPMILRYEALVEWPDACLGGKYESGPKEEANKCTETKKINGLMVEYPVACPQSPPPPCLEEDALNDLLEASPLMQLGDYSIDINPRYASLFGRDDMSYGQAKRQGLHSYIASRGGSPCLDGKQPDAFYSTKVQLDRGNKLALVEVFTLSPCERLALVTVPNLCVPKGQVFVGVGGVLDLPQKINTGARPTFEALTLSGLTAHGPGAKKKDAQPPPPPPQASNVPPPSCVVIGPGVIIPVECTTPPPPAPCIDGHKESEDRLHAALGTAPLVLGEYTMEKVPHESRWFIMKARPSDGAEVYLGSFTHADDTLRLVPADNGEGCATNYLLNHVTTVLLEPGDELALVDVKETSPCMYIARVTVPGLCDTLVWGLPQ